MTLSELPYSLRRRMAVEQLRSDSSNATSDYIVWCWPEMCQTLLFYDAHCIV